MRKVEQNIEERLESSEQYDTEVVSRWREAKYWKVEESKLSSKIENRSKGIKK